MVMGKYVFGPVPSRRLGISLGVDLVQAKTCNLNCVFCECGPTASWVTERGHFVSLEEVFQELDAALQELTPDFVTFSGSGEPTLSLDLGKVIDYIRNNYSVKIAVITNASLLSDRDVLEAVKKADVVMPSLHTVHQGILEQIVRPAPCCKMENILEGLQNLSKEFSGRIDLELFLLEGVNTSEEELKDYAAFIKTLSYHKLQLNSLDRPGAESWIQALSWESLQQVQKILEREGVKKIEVIGKFSSTKRLEKNRERLEAMKQRRIYTEEEIKSLYK